MFERLRTLIASMFGLSEEERSALARRIAARHELIQETRLKLEVERWEDEQKEKVEKFTEHTFRSMAEAAETPESDEAYRRIVERRNPSPAPAVSDFDAIESGSAKLLNEDGSPSDACIELAESIDSQTKSKIQSWAEDPSTHVFMISPDQVSISYEMDGNRVEKVLPLSQYLAEKKELENSRSEQQVVNDQASLGLTPGEQLCLSRLAQAFEFFSQMPNPGANDAVDFTRSMNELQRLIAIRTARRVDPDVWRTPTP